MSAPSSVAGVKYDAGKVRPSLLPWPALTEVMAVLAFGAAKYEPDNWQRVPGARERYFDAALRHLVAWHSGESLDAESGRHHLAHAACCVLFLLWFEVTATPWPTRGTTEPTRAEPTPTRAAPPPPATSSSKATSLEALDAAQRRRLRWRFEHRADRFASVPEGVTWADATASGSPWRTLLEASGRTLGRQKPDASRTLPGRSSDAPPPPSHSPLLPEIPEVLEEEEGAREDEPDARTPEAGRVPDASPGRPDARTPDASRTPPFSALEVLANASKGRVSGFASSRDQLAMAAALADVGLVGVAELEAFGRALAGDGAAKLWPKSEGAKGRGALTVGFFLGRAGDARMLADGVQRWREAQARAAEAARPVVVTAAPAAGSASVASTVEFFQQRRAGARPVAAVKEASNG